MDSYRMNSPPSKAIDANNQAPIGAQLDEALIALAELLHTPALDRDERNRVIAQAECVLRKHGRD